MSVVADVSVPAGDFPLGRILGSLTGVEMTLDTVVSTEGDLLPYLWVDCSDVDAIERVLSSDPDLLAFEVVHTVENQALVRTRWADHVDGLFRAIAGSDSTLLEGTGSGEQWRLQFRFPDRESLSV